MPRRNRIPSDNPSNAICHALLAHFDRDSQAVFSSTASSLSVIVCLGSQATRHSSEFKSRDIHNLSSHGYRACLDWRFYGQQTPPPPPPKTSCHFLLVTPLKPNPHIQPPPIQFCQNFSFPGERRAASKGNCH